eukprot:9612-Heterococcus_DN1.PRE.2
MNKRSFSQLSVPQRFKYCGIQHSADANSCASYCAALLNLSTIRHQTSRSISADKALTGYQPIMSSKAAVLYELLIVATCIAARFASSNKLTKWASAASCVQMCAIVKT